MEKNHLYYPHPPSRSYHHHNNKKPFNFFHPSSSNHEHHQQEDQNLVNSNHTVSTELSLSSKQPNNNIIKNPSSSSSSSSPSNSSIQSKITTAQWGYSTALKLYDDPWKIKKVLTASDLGKLNRLLLSSLNNSIDSLIGVVLSCKHGHRHREEVVVEEEEYLLSTIGKKVRVCDVDTMSMHELVLKRWASFKNYVLIGDWNQDFVKRRGLKKGDEIGLHWDSYNNCFNFSLLKPA